jgi:anti-sigma B factor antagonist
MRALTSDRPRAETIGHKIHALTGARIAAQREPRSAGRPSQQERRKRGVRSGAGWLRIRLLIRCRHGFLNCRAGLVTDLRALAIAAAVSGNTAVVRVKGELDLAAAQQLAEVLEGLEPVCRRMILDVSELGFIDSTGLRLAVIQRNRAIIYGFEFLIVGAAGPVMSVLRATGLDDTLRLAPDMTEAIRCTRRSLASDLPGLGFSHGAIA